MSKKSRPEIVQGSDRNLALTIRDANGDPIDLTAETEITAVFTKTDGTNLELTKTSGAITIVGNPILGKITILMTDTETSSLETGIKVDFKVYLDVGVHPGGTRRIVRFEQLIDVVDC